MSVALYVVGGFAVIAGIIAAAFGIPVSEFSFGNTLIIAGTVATVGGLIVIGLGAVVAKLQQIADGQVVPAGPARAAEEFGGAPAARIPFPTKPKADQPMRDEPRVMAPISGDAEPLPAPSLRNPDLPPVPEDVSLSPPDREPAAELGVPMRPAPLADEPAEAPAEPKLDTGWRPLDAPARQPSAYFDTVWPADSKPARPPAAEEPAEPQPEPAPAEPATEAVAAEAEEPQAVAVLKSGVVDGMAYTLYVDGSIEAELPQGTLRFASINELRSHLEKNS